MTSRKTSLSKSPKKSLNNSTGAKVQSSTGKSKTKASSSLKSKTQSNLKKNQSKLTTTGTPLKKRTSKTTSKKQTLIKVSNSRKIEMFPYLQTFPIFLKNETENKRCWFCCIEHAQKYIDRYKPKYKCYQYTGKQ